MFRSLPLHVISFQSGGKSDVKKKGGRVENVYKEYLFPFFFSSFYGQVVVTSRNVISALSSRADVTSRLIIVSICFFWSLFILTVSVRKMSSLYLSPLAPKFSLHDPSHFWRDCFPLAIFIFIIFLFF